eukprot:scaffold263002_cov31-Tisochrysis_lutea.AAC.2
MALGTNLVSRAVVRAGSCGGSGRIFRTTFQLWSPTLAARYTGHGGRGAGEERLPSQGSCLSTCDRDILGASVQRPNAKLASCFGGTRSLFIKAPRPTG